MVVKNRFAYWIISDTIDVIVRIRDIENAVASLEQIGDASIVQYIYCG
jgi:hypothetical protein